MPDATVAERTSHLDISSSPPPAVEEPQIVLAALVGLRWLAVAGQVAAAAVAAWLLGVRVPAAQVGGVVALTAASNVVLAWCKRFGNPPVKPVRAVLLLDVVLLTILLYLTGGPQNPFAALYLVHVAMAVIVLGTAWTWVIVTTVAACYGAILRWHLPLATARPLAPWVVATGNWVALALVSVLVAAFTGHVLRSLRQRERELADVRERAARNERLAALTTLAAGAAHELNTPLGTIAVVARELERSCTPPDATEAVREDARLIRREVERCRRILSRMRLNVDSGGRAERAFVRLGDLGERLREHLGEAERSRLTIRRDPAARAALAPPREIEQALLVLLRNAFDASAPDQGVSLDIARRDGRVRLVVTDHGCGMCEASLRRAGQPFFTTKEPGKGMGLGLFLVNLVAEQCGATFSLDSRPGKGTRCVLELAAAGDDGGDGGDGDDGDDGDDGGEGYG